jgi:hypothetical protein
MPESRTSEPVNSRCVEHKCSMNSFFFFFGGTRVWTQGLHICKAGALLFGVMLQVHFSLFILEMGSWELFAWAGLRLWASWSQLHQVARVTGVSHRHPDQLTLLDDRLQGWQGGDLPGYPVYIRFRSARFVLVFFGSTGFEPRAPHMLGRGSTTGAAPWVRHKVLKISNKKRKKINKNQQQCLVWGRCVASCLLQPSTLLHDLSSH